MQYSIKCLALVFGLVAFSHSASSAPPVYCDCRIIPEGYLFSLYVDGSTLPEFNGMRVHLEPTGLGQFLNYDADGVVGTTVLGPQDEYTFINLNLQIPEAGGGLGFAVIKDSGNGPDQIFYEAGKLGGFIDPSEPVFLNNFIVPNGGGYLANVLLSKYGDPIYQTTQILPLDFECVPEPDSVALFAIGFAGVILHCRLV